MDLQLKIKARGWRDVLGLRAYTAPAKDTLGSQHACWAAQGLIPSFGPWCYMYACVHTNAETRII